MYAPEDLRRRVKALFDAHGQREAARLLGVNLQTMLAVSAGARVLRGTIALVEQGLSRLEASDGGEAA